MFLKTMGVLSTIQLRVWGFCPSGFCPWGFCPGGGVCPGGRGLSVPRIIMSGEIIRDQCEKAWLSVTMKSISISENVNERIE